MAEPANGLLNGHDGIVKLPDTGEVIGEVKSWSLDISVETQTKNAMGTEWSRTVTTFKSASGSLELNQAVDDPHNNIVEGDRFQLELYPGGEFPGAPYVSAAVRVTSVSESVNMDGTADKTISWQNDGTVTRTTVSA